MRVGSGIPARQLLARHSGTTGESEEGHAGPQGRGGVCACAPMGWCSTFCGMALDAFGVAAPIPLCAVSAAMDTQWLL